MEIVGGEERETSWPDSLSGQVLSFLLFLLYFSFPALLDNLFHRHQRSIVEPDPVPDRSLVTRLGKIGRRRASRPPGARGGGGARYARCRPVIGDRKQGGCYKLGDSNARCRALETLVSIVETFERNGHCPRKIVTPLEVKEKKNLDDWMDFFYRNNTVRIKFLKQQNG